MSWWTSRAASRRDVTPAAASAVASAPVSAAPASAAPVSAGPVSAAPIAEPHAGSGAGTTRSPSERAIAFFELTKPRITGLVLLTTAVGFQIASTAAVDLVLLLHALLGTALTAGGTNALNQYVERGPDAAMHRTRGRPLPSGRLSAREGLLFAVLISLAGIGYLAYFVNGITAIFAAATLVSYVAAYTPLKQITPWSTAVGGISGALPIVGGWTAATGRLAPATWALFGILFLWQLPHFLGLGWLCRDDYRRGGFQILAVRDPSGRRTATQSLIVLALLLPTAALPTLFGLTGIVYLVGGLGLGLAFLACGIQFAIRPEAATARRLFLASVLYLPVLLLLMVIDKV